LSRTHVPAALRRLVVSRADGICEYCLIPHADTHFGCEVDHILSEKHGGLTVADNLAYSCLYCNRFKGSDLGSIGAGGQLVPLFHPRRDRWNEHFRLDDDMTLQPLTPVGEVTVRLLAMNADERLFERRALHAENRYPPAADGFRPPDRA
jgi:hypothetical protein